MNQDRQDNQESTKIDAGVTGEQSHAGSRFNILEKEDNIKPCNPCMRGTVTGILRILLRAIMAHAHLLLKIIRKEVAMHQRSHHTEGISNLSKSRQSPLKPTSTRKTKVLSPPVINLPQHPHKRKALLRQKFFA